MDNNRFNLSPISPDMRDLSEQRKTQFENQAAQSPIETQNQEPVVAPQETFYDPLANFPAEEAPVENPNSQPETATFVQEIQPTTFQAVEQPVFYQPQPTQSGVEFQDSKPDRIKERWSIVLGFGAIPITIIISYFIIYTALQMALGGLFSSSAVQNGVSFLPYIFLILSFGILGLGFWLGHKYEKSTGKISAGKMMSLVSGSIILIISAVSVYNYIQTQIRIEESKKKYQDSLQQYQSPSFRRNSLFSE